MKNYLERVLLGTAVGDSMGLPTEGLSARNIQKRWVGPLSQSFVCGRGMVSDDTEHSVFVAQCLAASPQNAQDFQRKLGWKLRRWLLCFPAGIGFATLRATLKLWLGFSTSRSGVFSAGNGPAMRSAIIGAYFSKEPERLKDYVSASTRLTHTDPKAEVAALAVALTAAWSTNTNQLPRTNLEALCKLWHDAGSEDSEWQKLVEIAFQNFNRGSSVAEFAAAIGLERAVTGYSYHSVPVALYAWLVHYGDFGATIEAVISCGGDTDTVAAIAGGLAAIRADIPPDWLGKLCDYPISTNYVRRLGWALETKSEAPLFAWPILPIRNAVFTLIVLLHCFRRLLPH